SDRSSPTKKPADQRPRRERRRARSLVVLAGPPATLVSAAIKNAARGRSHGLARRRDGLCLIARTPTSWLSTSRPRRRRGLVSSRGKRAAGQRLGACVRAR